LAVEIGDETVLGTLDDVVCEPLVEREVRCLLLVLLYCMTEVRGDGCDMELIDRDFLISRLLPPIFGGGLEQVRVRIVRWNVGGRCIEEQVLRQATFLHGNGCESLELFGVDDRE